MSVQPRSSASTNTMLGGAGWSGRSTRSAAATTIGSETATTSKAAAQEKTRRDLVLAPLGWNKDMALDSGQGKRNPQYPRRLSAGQRIPHPTTSLFPSESVGL